MHTKITAVINTFNEQKNLKRAVSSVNWVDEIIICDMHSTDKTVEIAKKMGAMVIYHRKENYVEPARNFAISKAKGDWILILDADEEIPEVLAEEIKKIVKNAIASDFIEIPRKNIIFSKWIKSAAWWPDYQIRFFKKGSVSWNNKIHSKPKILGIGLKLLPKEKFAIIHHNYDSISQFINRMDRYTTIEANDLRKQGKEFNLLDLLNKPLEEFLSRFFANKGYEDGLHGLILSILQAFSFFVVYIKLWESYRFKEMEIRNDQIIEEKEKVNRALDYWLNKSNFSLNPFKKIFQKIKG